MVERLRGGAESPGERQIKAEMDEEAAEAETHQPAGKHCGKLNELRPESMSHPHIFCRYELLVRILQAVATDT